MALRRTSDTPRVLRVLTEVSVVVESALDGITSYEFNFVYFVLCSERSNIVYESNA
jgi:hypothetical protein